DTSSVVSALFRGVGQPPNELKKSLTWDRRSEVGN
ncbi:MAG: hypothetical protein ACI90S_000233, partial [Marinobacter psychrophilus]